MKPWRSLAASYSAFSLRSPWARASAIASIILGRSFRRRSCSAFNASYPFFVIGVGIVLQKSRQLSAINHQRFRMNRKLRADGLSFMVFLQGTDRQSLFLNRLDSHDGRPRAPDSREIGDVALKRLASDGGRIDM